MGGKEVVIVQKDNSWADYIRSLVHGFDMRRGRVYREREALSGSRQGLLIDAARVKRHRKAVKRLLDQARAYDNQYVKWGENNGRTPRRDSQWHQ